MQDLDLVETVSLVNDYLSMLLLTFSIAFHEAFTNCKSSSYPS